MTLVSVEPYVLVEIFSIDFEKPIHYGTRVQVFSADDKMTNQVSSTK